MAEDIVDKATLLASMVVADNRKQAVLRTYPSWRGVSAILHEHVLVEGLEVSRDRTVAMPAVNEVLAEDLVTNREKNGFFSPTEFVISHKGLTYLTQCCTTASAK